MSEKLLAYNKDPKSKAREFLLPLSQRDAEGPMPSSLTHRVQSDDLDALGKELSANQINRDRAKAARRYAHLSRTTKAPVPS